MVGEYVAANGRNRYSEWIERLEPSTAARVQQRVLRFELGNFGDHKPVGGGVWECRLAFGPGYRIYFGIHRRAVVLLLLGGAKDTQTKDIRQAKKDWQAFLETKGHGEAMG